MALRASTLSQVSPTHSREKVLEKSLSISPFLALAAVALEILVQSPINFPKEEISVIRGLHKDAEQLKTTLLMIQTYLKKFIAQEAVRIWLKELETVSFDADNVLDELNYHLLFKKLKSVKEKVLSFIKPLDHVARCPRAMAHKIEQINLDFDFISKRAAQLGLESIVVNAAAAVLDAVFETDSFTLDPIFVGRDDDVQRLVEMMSNNSPEEIGKFLLISIVDMGGMGKTKFTRKVFNHGKIKAQFGSHIWVYVSQIFDPEKSLQHCNQMRSNGRKH